MPSTSPDFAPSMGAPIGSTTTGGAASPTFTGCLIRASSVGDCELHSLSHAFAGAQGGVGGVGMSASSPPPSSPRPSSSLFDPSNLVTAAASASAASANYWSLLSPSNKIKLNIGGQIFQTSLLTLQQCPPPSLFSAMFSGKWTPDIDDRGCFFIDRDPTYFRHILNYLRDGGGSGGYAVAVSGLSASSKQALLREAQFYQIGGLVSLLSQEVNRMKMMQRRELSQEKEYKLMLNVQEKELAATMTRMTMSEGYDIENWMRGEKDKRSVHLLLSKKLSRGELMLLDRLQTHM